VNWFAGNHTRLLRNVASPRNWLDVRVVGKTVNRDGIGSRIEVRSGDKLLGVQEIATGFGYASGQMPIAHFGLGDVAAVDVTILLPGGTKPILRRDVRANQLLIVNE